MIKDSDTLHHMMIQDEAKIGYVEIPTKMTTKRMMDVILQNFIPIAAEANYDRKVITYLGFSHHFEVQSTQNTSSAVIPLYFVQLREKNDVILFDSFVAQKR